MLKLSTLMRRGIEDTGHCVDSYVQWESGKMCTCALGAAAYGFAREEYEDSDDFDDQIDKWGSEVIDLTTAKDATEEQVQAVCKRLGVDEEAVREGTGPKSGLWLVLTTANDDPEADGDPRPAILAALEEVGL